MESSTIFLVEVPLSTHELQTKLNGLRLSLVGMHKAVANTRDQRRSQTNSRRNARKANFSLGEFVLVSNTVKRTKSKLSARWSGPHRITEVLSDKSGKFVWPGVDLKLWIIRGNLCHLCTLMLQSLLNAIFLNCQTVMFFYLLYLN